MLSLGWMEPAKVLCFCVTSFPSCVMLFSPYSCMHILLSCSGLKCSCSYAISCLGRMQELLETLLQKFFFYQMFLCHFFSLIATDLCVFIFSLDENTLLFLYLCLYLDAIATFLSHQRRMLGLSVLVKVIWLALYYTSKEKLPHRFSFSKDSMWSLYSCNSPGGRWSDFSLGVVHSCLFQPRTI